MSLSTAARQYAQIARAIRYLDAHVEQQPSLETLAQAVHLSPTHLQRVFTRWAGLSPKRFLQYLTRQHAKARLRADHDLLSVSLELGMSGPGCLHALMVTYEAMTPGQIRRGGQGLAIAYGCGPSPFGTAWLAWTARGLCQLAFCDTAPADPAAALREHWPHAVLSRDDGQARAWLANIFPPDRTPGRAHLLLHGSPFQLRVWEALIHSSAGSVLSYRQLAAQSGAPRAARAVGSALAANKIGYLIPCHRVIRESGDVGQFRWGRERKQAMQLWEAGRHAALPPAD